MTKPLMIAARAILRQHREALESVIARHLLWNPRLVTFTTRPGDSVVELCDGRAFLVRTAPIDDGYTYQTTVTKI